MAVPASKETAPNKLYRTRCLLSHRTCVWSCPQGLGMRLTRKPRHPHMGRSQSVEANRVYADNTDAGSNGARTMVAVTTTDFCSETLGPSSIPPDTPNYNLP